MLVQTPPFPEFLGFLSHHVSWQEMVILSPPKPIKKVTVALPWMPNRWPKIFSLSHNVHMQWLKWACNNSGKKNKQYPFHHLLEESMLPHESLSRCSWRQWKLKDLSALCFYSKILNLLTISLSSMIIFYQHSKKDNSNKLFRYVKSCQWLFLGSVMASLVAQG